LYTTRVGWKSTSTGSGAKKAEMLSCSVLMVRIELTRAPPLPSRLALGGLWHHYAAVWATIWIQLQDPVSIQNNRELTDLLIEYHPMLQFR